MVYCIPLLKSLSIGRKEIPMNKYLINLSKSVIFNSIDINTIETLINSITYKIRSFSKGDIISLEGDDCSNLGIILSGGVEIHKPFPSGKIVTINNFSAGNVFGEAILFSESHKYPANVIASDDSKVMYISKSELIKLMTLNDIILNNFLSVLSNRILMLNDRITNLSLDTIRKKIANIILLEYRKQNKNIIVLPFCRKKMAEMLNIPRPSLSRELSKMKEDNIINFNKNKIQILDIDLLESCLFE